MELEAYKVEKLPPSIFYVPDFITKEQEEYLLNRIEKSPRTKWTQLRNRRLQNWGGMPHQKGMIPEQIPDWLQDVINRVVAKGGPAFGGVMPNHILLNEYLAGQGISPHLDGDLFHPTIATVSLGSHTVLNYYRNEKNLDSSYSQFSDRLEFSILLQPRSLLLVKDSMYADFLHGIDEITADVISERLIVPDDQLHFAVGQTLQRKTRVSLTIRHVPKTLSKFKFKI